MNGHGRNDRSWLNSVEYFYFDSLSWTEGPDLPVSISGAGVIVDTGDSLLFLGGGADQKKMFKLDHNLWMWSEVGELAVGRIWFGAAKLNMTSCK